MNVPLFLISWVIKCKRRKYYVCLQYPSNTNDMKRLLYFTTIIVSLLFLPGCEKGNEEAKDLKEETPSVENGHQFVDLGFSVKWATCNVGATKPEEYGDYYVWGDTVVVVDSHIKKWGGRWRIPTQAEQLQLYYDCTWTWYDSGNTEFNGVAGYKVTSKIEGYTDRFIFLPAAGNRFGSSSFYVGSEGCYWSSSLYMQNMGQRCYLSFSSDRVSWLYYYPSTYALSIRPVCP